VESHAAIVARAELMSVMLPGGIALDHATFRPITGALRLIWSASSRLIAFGAAASVGHAGSAVCHMLQRVLTIRSISAKLAPQTPLRSGHRAELPPIT